MKTRIYFLLIVMALVQFSCVPLKQFTDLNKKTQTIEDNNQLLKEENRDLTVQLNELDGKFSTLEHRYFDLEQKSKNTLSEHERLLSENERLKKNQSDLEHQIDMLKEGSSEEITQLLKELQELQLNLQDREDRVRMAEDKLNEQEAALKIAQQELADKQQKLQELQQALNDQRSAVSALKDKLNSALRGFYDQGLSVHEKNGKVYISMEEKLLFKTGSYNLDPNGQAALQSLSEVLAANKDIHIMVEGHTDNVPLNGANQIKDNWDLSVMRATAVTKIILNNTDIDPARITAAGRSEYVPLDPDNSVEARRRNRRTEIILTPNLSEVLKIIESN